MNTGPITSHDSFTDTRKSKVFSCFRIEKNGFVELRDCHLRSFLDEELQFNELENFMSQHRQSKRDFYEASR